LIWSPEEYPAWSIKDEASHMQFSTASIYLLLPKVTVFSDTFGLYFSLNMTD